MARKAALNIQRVKGAGAGQTREKALIERDASAAFANTTPVWMLTKH